MPLSDSPRFDADEMDAPLGAGPLPEPAPEAKPPTKRPRWTRILIGVLVIAIVFSGALFVLMRTRPVTETRAGSSTIQGIVVDTQGDPIPDAQVYVEGMESEVRTDARGAFAINNAPSGQVMVVVGVTPEPPFFLSVNVGTGDTNDVGEIAYQPRAQ